MIRRAVSDPLGTITPMTVREHMAITLAATPYRYPGRRDEDALHTLGMTPPRFWQVVDALLDRPDVEAAHPQIVARLKRLQERRRAARGA